MIIRNDSLDWINPIVGYTTKIVLDVSINLCHSGIKSESLCGVNVVAVGDESNSYKSKQCTRVSRLGVRRLSFIYVTCAPMATLAIYVISLIFLTSRFDSLLVMHAWL